MDIEYQKQLVESCLRKREEIERKDRIIKKLSFNKLTRFLFRHRINILDLEVMLLLTESMGSAISGIVDVKFGKRLDNMTQTLGDKK